MFKVGENVFCPMRGTGIVEAIEERCMLDEVKEYFIINMKCPELTMMIPTDKIATSGFRAINDECVADEVMSILENKETDIDYSVDIKQRIKQNQEKLSSGLLIECSEVVRDLAIMENERPLNNSERMIFMQAKRLLLDELATIKHISDEEVEEIVDRLLAK
ncbi:MAG: hypothetical protein H9872_02980 [Candidatus Cellulosilyticum pullistercoris]|uniref:CarD-like/TRCF RNAP-interacting domain-containing protein n=1 Tax=Candidatus Cellulosilyticum pullistercoris TaxID=2838521 RepID=A0A9E2KBZ1_9FIRM|nr:hypothetical protein [Candidatus Cellulosilyticum pullistercoris]